MTTTFEKLAKLRELYPDDVKRIAADEERVADLLRQQEYSELQTTKELLALCRKDILAARIKLATVQALSDAHRAELWSIIDARAWFVRMVAKDYNAELATIDRELETELSR